MNVRTLIAICNGCGRETIHRPDRAIEHADELVEWLKTHIRQCICGAPTFDVKIPIAEVEEQKESVQ